MQKSGKSHWSCCSVTSRLSLLESETGACNPFETVLSCWRQIARSATKHVRKKNVSDVGSVLKQDFQDDMAIILHMVSSQVASNIPQVCWIVLMARTLVMMAKLMPQVSACTKDRDEDLASDPNQRMETGSEIASSKNLHVLWSKLRHLYHKSPAPINPIIGCHHWLPIVNPNHWLKSSRHLPLSSPTCWWTPSHWKVPRAAWANISCLKIGDLPLKWSFSR